MKIFYDLIDYLRFSKREINFDYLFKSSILFIAYLFTGELGLKIHPSSNFATLFWMPTGISLAFLFLYGKKYWPSIFLGAFYVNFTTGAPFLLATSFAIGNTLEALLGNHFLRKYKFSGKFTKLSDALTLITYASILSTLASATIGTVSLYYSGRLTDHAFNTWFVWWTGNIISNLVVAPFLISWGENPKLIFNSSKVTEAVVLGILTIGLSILVFTGALGIFFKNAPFDFLAYPPLMLLSLRFKPRETFFAVFTIAIIATWTTYNGFGPFAVNVTRGNLLFLEGFIATLATTALILSSSNEERRRLEKSKEEFMALATHELKTPLTSMKVYSEILEKNLSGKNDVKNENMALKLKNQIDKLTTLVSDILDISRIDERMLRIDQSYFDLNELIDEVLEDMRAITEKNEFVTKLVKSKTIFADRLRIGQVMLNLLSNAIKFSPKNTQIEIYTKIVDNKIVFCVKDSGIGISKNEIPRVFEKTYRGEGKETYPGLGLGLYISKEIIVRHQGDIWVKSQKGKGAEFCFSIPIRES